jgi:sugar O-acyltransferase (sialic acid O-acetyltransferase NeuD family)
MKPIVIYGAGGQGREVLMLIRQINENHHEWNPIGFIDDQVAANEVVNGLFVLGNIDYLNTMTDEIYVVIAMGYSGIRKMAFEKIHNKKVVFATLIHPSVQIAPYQYCSIGEGTVITAGNILTVNISIGKHVLLNIHSTIGHDAVIEDFVSIMFGCNISGNVTIKEGAFLGSGTAVLNGLTVNEGATSGAGTVIINNVPAHATVVGVPAKQINQSVFKQ